MPTETDFEVLRAVLASVREALAVKTKREADVILESISAQVQAFYLSKP